MLAPPSCACAATHLSRLPALDLWSINPLQSPPPAPSLQQAAGKPFLRLILPLPHRPPHSQEPVQLAAGRGRWWTYGSENQGISSSKLAMAANVGGSRSAGAGPAGGGAGGSVAPAVCRASGSRWTPTPEQIRILKELYYGCGIRSPNAEQIQRITAMLRQHGKIEGKNVFYWFQNHKARERQKRRLTSLDVNAPAAGAAADATSHHLGVLSPSSGAAPPSSTLGFCTVGNGGGSALLLDTSSDWVGSTATAPAMATETCFLQDYMGVRSTGSAAAASPWACFSSSDPRATRAPETLPLFPTRDDSPQGQPPRPRHGAPTPAGEAVRSGSYLPTLPFWGAAATTASSTTGSVVIQQQHQLLQLQEPYRFYSNSQLPGQDASTSAAAAAASLELSLSSWCSTP